MVAARSGAPRTEKPPSAYPTSSSAASSRWAAIFVALSRSLRATIAVAAPPTGVDRDAYVPSP